MALLLVSVTSADLSDGLTACFDWESPNPLNDLTGSYTATNYDSINTTGLVGASARSVFDQNDGLVTSITSLPSQFSLSGIYKPTSSGVYRIVDWKSDGLANYEFTLYCDNNDKWRLTTNAGSYIGATNCFSGNNYNYVLTYDNSDYRLYVNGVLSFTYSYTMTASSHPVAVAGYPHSSQTGKGYHDELKLWDRVLSPSEVSQDYNSGAYTSCASLVVVSPSDNFTVSVFDAWDSSAVNNVTVSIDGIDYTNTSGNRVTTLIYVNDSSTYDINISNFEHFDSFYYDVNVSFALSAYMNASDVKFRGFNIFGEEFNSNFTIDSITKESNESFYLSSGNHSVTVSSAGYFPYFEVVNVSPLDNKTLNITGLYTINLSIYPRDVLNNNSISGVNITLKNTSRGFSQSFTNVSEGFFSIMEGCYNLTLVASGRNDLTESICLNTTGNLTHYAYMYAFNSLWVYAYDLLNGSNISNFNVTVQNANYSYSNNSISGIARLSNILSGTYDVFVSSPDYDPASYVVTVTDNSFQTLDAYLIQSNGTFIFTIQDKATGGSLEGASIDMKRYINSTLTTVAVKYSDITGRAEFNYNDGVVYYFTLSKNNYDTKDFSLEILFNSYTVLMTPSSSTNESVFIDDVSFSLVGSNFVNSTSWVSYYFNSPLGSLENYNISILLSNGSLFTASGSSAGGSVLNVSVATPSAQFGDVAVVYLNYKSSFNAGVSSYSFIFPFETFTPSSSSLYFFKSDLADSSDLSKSFWGSIVVLVVASIFSVFGLFLGDILLTGSIGGVFGFVVVAALGLFNLVVASIAIFILIMLIIGRVVSSG